MKKASTTTLLLWQRNTDHCYEIYVTKELKKLIQTKHLRIFFHAEFGSWQSWIGKNFTWLYIGSVVTEYSKIVSAVLGSKMRY